MVVIGARLSVQEWWQYALDSVFADSLHRVYPVRNDSPSRVAEMPVGESIRLT